MTTEDLPTLTRGRTGPGRRQRRAHHKIYVGMAAGVGKTYRALQELEDLRAEGVDAVIGLLETHGRQETAAMAEGLEVVPRRTVEYKGVALSEMDTDAVVARRPGVALVDELAHTNVPGSPRPKRYEDVDVLLRAGIDVISTMNVQHIESLNDLVEQLTGVRVHERVPDRVLLDADELVLIDVTPEVLRQRLENGKIYAPQKVDRALNNFFKVENLLVLRELALRQVADAVEGPATGERPGIKERVAVAITPTPNAARLIRRGARLAQRLNAELHVVFVRDRPLSREAERLLDTLKVVTRSLDGRFTIVEDRRTARGLAAALGKLGVTHLVMGASLRDRWQERVRGSIIQQVLRATHGVDVTIVGREPGAAGGGTLDRKPTRP